MSTDLVNEEERLGFQLTRFARGNGLMYQITQDDNHTPLYSRLVQLTEEQIELILERIRQGREDLERQRQSIEKE